MKGITRPYHCFGSGKSPLLPTSFVWLLLAFVVFGIGCTGTGRLQEGERLYTGAKVKIEKADKEWSTKILKTDFKKSVTIPRPNKKILWMRPRLVIYNMFKNRREKSFGNFIANRFGQAPVLYQATTAGRHRELLSERAANDGFFKTKIDSEEKIKKHTVKIVHTVFVQSPREKVDKVVFPYDTSAVMLKIYDLRPKSLVDSGQYYHLEEMIAERQRLSDTLRNNGWYYFSPDNLIFEADTLHPRGDMNLTLRIKKEVGERERQQYRLGDITVYTDYDLAKEAKQKELPTDSLSIGCIRYVYHYLSTKPDIINDQIFLRCGELYSNDDYQATVYRLLNLNIYKFINIRFEVSPQSDTLLDAKIYLTPNRPERVEATLSGVFSPSAYYGVRVGTAYSHRNIFRGAEALRIALNGSYLRTDKSNFDFEDFLVSDASARLSVPRFLLLPERKSLAFSTTQFSLRHETNWFRYDLPELGDFRLSFQRAQAEGGYLWKKNRLGSMVHEVNPLSIGLQYSTINNDLLRGALISKIPEDTTGTLLPLLTFLEYKPNYTFTFDQRLDPAKRLNVYFRQRFALQASGYTRSKYLPEGFDLASPLNLFIESDYRQYQKTNGRNVLAFRAAVGAGIPLRPGGTIALLDRYVIGGASSVRAFAPRTIGPGTVAPDAVQGLAVGKYTGNMLLETSLEYRMPLGRYPELAVFLDAGNVWLTSGPDATDASKFRIDRFYKELAVGTGVGLRVNLGFFVLRLDLAFPLTRPYNPEGERWVGDELRFNKQQWRSENLNWNFSFGYPF